VHGSLGSDELDRDQCSALPGSGCAAPGVAACPLTVDFRIRRLRNPDRQKVVYAAAAGLVVAPRVTKALDVLVVADPDSLSSKARKAREYGTRIMAEAVFWQAIGVSVE